MSYEVGAILQYGIFAMSLALMAVIAIVAIISFINNWVKGQYLVAILVGLVIFLQMISDNLGK